MAQDDWEDVDVPRGAYIGWGYREGQHVTGEVIDYGYESGLDFNKEKCPQLSMILTDKASSFNKQGERKIYEPDTLVVLNCGQVSLKRAVRAADPKVGDMLKITLANILEDGGKTIKEFKIQRKRGNGQLSSNAERAMTAASAKQDDDSFNRAGFAQDDEPPF
jgi:hypothetical protein